MSMTVPRSSPDHSFTIKPTLRSLVLAFVTCLAPSPSLLAQSAAPVTSAPPRVASEPPNVGDAKAAATAYYDSGAYARDLVLVAAEAGAWIAQRAPQVSRPALVLDIDDTALTNWEVIKASNRGACY
jgi:hypothetical protein